MNDAALTRLFLRFRDQRNGRALAAVFDALARELFQVGAHLVRDANEAEDLVQSTFRVAIERAGSFDRDRSLRGWLYGILANEARLSRRRAARRPDPEALAKREERQPIDQLIDGEVPAVLHQAVERLPAPYREVVDAVVCGGKSSGEVARELDRAPGTVRVQAQRGLQKLRRLLPREFGLPGMVPLPMGLERLREAVLRQAGIPTSAAPSGVGVAAETALAVVSTTSAVWIAPLVLLAVSVPWWMREPRAAAVPPTTLASQVEPEAANGIDPTVTETTPSVDPRANPNGAGAGGKLQEERERIRIEQVFEHPENPQVEGFVLDEEDRPVPGVLVRARQNDSEGFPHEFRSSDDGRFSFAGLEEGWWFFSVDEEAWARVWWRAFGAHVPRAGKSEKEVRLRLFEPRTVEGLVVDEAGRPVAGARVALRVEWVDGEKRPRQGHLTQVLAEDESDGEGRFRFTRLSPGQMNVVLDHPDYSRTRTSFRTDDDPVRVVIERGPSVTGRVVTADGQPLEGVKVVGRTSREAGLSMGEHEAVTDEMGRFAIEHIHSRHHVVEHGIPTIVLQVSDEAWISGGYWVHEWTPNVLPEVTLVAHPTGAEVEPGRVHVGRDLAREAAARGEPYGEASLLVSIDPELELAVDQRVQVYVRGRSPGLEEVFEHGNLEGHGPTRFESIPAGRYQISAASSLPPNLPPVEVEVGDSGQVEVVLGTGTITLSGRIRCAAEPVGDVNIYCSGPMRGIGTVQPDGSYAIEGLVPGNYELGTWSTSDFDNYFEVQVTDDGTGQAYFDVPLPTGVVAGQVRGIEFGDRQREVQVFPRGWGVSSGNRGCRATVDDAGLFRMRFVPAGEYKLYTQHTELACKPVTVQMVGDRVEDVLIGPVGETVSVAGRVTNPAMTGPYRSGTSLLLVAHDAGGHAFGLYGGYAQVDGETGAFEIEDVAPGTYGVHVTDYQAIASHLWIPDLVVPPGGLADLSITIPEGRGVSIVLDGGDPPPRQRIWYLHMPTGQRLPFYAFIGTGARGLVASSKEFRLPYGEYLVEADFGHGRTVTRNLLVEHGEGPIELVVPLE